MLKYKCSYGYRLNAQNLVGADPVNELVITDDITIDGREHWYCFVDGGDHVPTVDNSDRKLASALFKMLGDFSSREYVTLIPNKLYYPLSGGSAVDGAVMHITNVFDNAFYNCPKLMWFMSNVSYANINIVTFAYLKKCERYVDGNGQFYRVNSNTGLLEAVIPTTYAQPRSFPSASSNYGGASPSNASCTVRVPIIGNNDSGNDYVVWLTVSNYEWPDGARGAYRAYTTVNTYPHSQFIANLKEVLNYANVKPDEETDPDEEPDDDPYEDPFDPKPSKPGGGGGTKVKPTPQPTPIPVPGDLPNIAGSGLVTIYNPSTSDIEDLAALLWSEDFVDKLIKLRKDPFDVIIGLHIIPVAVTGSSYTLKLGNYDTSVYGAHALSFRKVTEQYVTVDCGDLEIREIWGSYLDYKTRFELYLPFIGFREIHSEDVLNKTLNVSYMVDVLTGSCNCYVKSNDMVVMNVGGNCALHVPVTGSDYSEQMKALIGAAAGVTATVATAGIASPAAAAAAMGAAANVLTSKAHIQRSGGLSGAMGFMGVRKPYLLAYVPNECIPKNQNKFKGYPSYITAKIGDLSGYTEIESVHFSGVGGATDEELEEIRSLLDRGIII